MKRRTRKRIIIILSIVLVLICAGGYGLLKERNREDKIVEVDEIKKEEDVSSTEEETPTKDTSRMEAGRSLPERQYRKYQKITILMEVLRRSGTGTWWQWMRDIRQKAIRIKNRWGPVQAR